jgi:hypothetical protein
VDDLSSRLLAAIGETEQAAPNIHREGCKSLPPWQDWHPRTCDCAMPASVLRRCAADRKILELHKPEVYETDEWDENHVLVEVEYLYCPRCWAAADYPAHSNPPAPYPCEHVRLLAEGYGLTDRSEGEA